MEVSLKFSFTPRFTVLAPRLSHLHWTHPPHSTLKTWVPEPLMECSTLDAFFSGRWFRTLLRWSDSIFFLWKVGTGPGVPSGATCLLHVGQTPSITFFPLSSSNETISSSSPAVISHVAWFPNLPELQPSFTGWLLIRIFPPSTNLCSWLQPHPPEPQEKQDCEPHWAGLRFSFICAEH